MMDDREILVKSMAAFTKQPEERWFILNNDELEQFKKDLSKDYTTVKNCKYEVVRKWEVKEAYEKIENYKYVSTLTEHIYRSWKTLWLKEYKWTEDTQTFIPAVYSQIGYVLYIYGTYELVKEEAK